MNRRTRHVVPALLVEVRLFEVSRAIFKQELAVLLDVLCGVDLDEALGDHAVFLAWRARTGAEDELAIDGSHHLTGVCQDEIMSASLCVFVCTCTCDYLCFIVFRIDVQYLMCSCCTSSPTLPALILLALHRWVM